MAIPTSTLKLSIRETITLNNNKYDSFITKEIPSINEYSKRIITVPTTNQDIIKVSGSIGPGAYITEDVKYIRITNLDANNHVNLTFKNSRTPAGLNDEFAMKLDEGQTFIFPGLTTGGVSASMAAVDNATIIDTTGDIEAMGSLTNVTAQASGSAVDLELIIASS